MGSMNKFVLMWAEKVSLLTIDFFSQSFIHYIKFPWNEINYSIISLKDQKILQAHISKEDYEKLKKVHPKYFLEKNKILQIIKKYEELGFEFEKFVQKISKFDFGSFSREELLPLFKEYVKIQLLVIAYFRATRPEAEIEVEKILRNRLKLYYDSQNEVEKAFHIITESPEPDTLKRERFEWLKIVLQKEVKDDQLLKHAKKFPDFFLNVYDHNDAISFLRKRLEESRKNFRDKIQEVENIKKRLNRLKREQQKVYRKCNDKLIKTYSFMFQKFGKHRFELKSVWAGAEFVSLPLLNKISSSIGISVKDMCNTYSVNDMINFLKYGKKLSNKIIKDRKKCVVYIVKDRQPKIIQGKHALEFLKKTIKKEQISTELKGTVANPGTCKGIAKVMMSTDIKGLSKYNKNFKKGDILVTDMTQPNMVLIIKKASAIITNVGGLTSHAAIMSREFDIPCVVGTLKATKTLRDGDLVEVDANKGIIKIIKKK